MSENDTFVVEPSGEAELRIYTDEEIAQFLKEDKLDPEVAAKVRRLLEQQQREDIVWALKQRRSAANSDGSETVNSPE